MPLPKPSGPRETSGKRVAQTHALVRTAPRVRSRAIATLSIDIGGTGIKMIVLDQEGKPLTERMRMLTPHPARPAAVLEVIRRMLVEKPRFDRVSVGFPGVVVDGVVQTAANLGLDFWKGYDLRAAIERLTGAPTRVINDADLQGYGVIEGRGVELVLTFGTGLGSALFVDGKLVPNLELGHQPFKKGKTYEERVRDDELKRIGKRDWIRRVHEALEQIAIVFNPRVMHLGGGNANHLKNDLPVNARLFTNVEGMTGGIRLWTDPKP
ncbi:MAG TPA: ROK family protein [Polyangiaceae bacterium]|jgi:polyphosphate glucokinase|nr:ROK family protein [Polyangiaceae bacterium]